MVTTRLTGAIRCFTAPSRLALALTLAGAATALMGLTGAPGASAATAPVSLGTAANYAVLAASTVTNTGPTTINGDLGLSPGTAITGFPPGDVSGTTDAADSAAVQAQSDLTAAYTAAAASPVTATIPVELGGTTVTPGVYASPAGTFGITGTLTLDAQGDPNAVFIFRAASTLITASASSVELVNGAQASNVFWVVGSSATLGTYSVLQGNVMAMASITVTTGVTLDGRALARTAAVTLDSDTITAPASVQAPTSTTTSRPRARGAAGHLHRRSDRQHRDGRPGRPRGVHGRTRAPWRRHPRQHRAGGPDHLHPGRRPPPDHCLLHRSGRIRQQPVTGSPRTCRLELARITSDADGSLKQMITPRVGGGRLPGTRPERLRSGVGAAPRDSTRPAHQHGGCGYAAWAEIPQRPVRRVQSYRQGIVDSKTDSSTTRYPGTASPVRAPMTTAWTSCKVFTCTIASPTLTP
jgi:hypothetical protein